MSLISIAPFNYTLAAPLTASDTVELRVWYTGSPGEQFIDADGNVVPYGNAQQFYLPIECTVSGDMITIGGHGFELSATDNSSNISAVANAQFYVNGSPSTFLFTDWIITATLGVSTSFDSLYTYNLAAQLPYALDPLYLTAPQIAVLLASNKANVSPLIDPVNGKYGVTSLSVAPANSADPIARGINDATNPYLINRTGVLAVTGATGQGLDIKLTGNDDSLDFGGLLGSRVALVWNGTGSSFHQTLQPHTAFAQHAGTGRIDSAIGYTSAISNTGGGILQEPRIFSGAVQNISGIVGQSPGVFSDFFQSGTASVSTYVALFQGRFRNFSGTPSAAAVYGLYLGGAPGWSKVGGSTVTYSSAIEVEDNTRIGTTAWMIHSTSLANSLLQGGLTVGAVGTLGQLRFAGSTSGTVTVQPKAVAGTWSLTLPDTAGTNGFVLQTDGTGITSWVAQSGGGGSAPGGSNTQVQYNAAGVLGGITNATSNGTVLTVTNGIYAGTVTLSALTSNGFVKTGGGTGLLSIDTNTYLTGNQTITLSGDVSGVGATAIITTIGTGRVTNTMLAGSISEDKLIGTDIFRLGTITTGVWNAGNVTANGNLASIAATANVYLKDTNTGFQAATTLVVTPQANNVIRSTNFTSGLVGWSIDAIGNAEFANVDVRGAIHASVITYNAILATSGTLGVFKSAAKLLNDVVVTAGPTYGTTTFNIDVEDQDGLTHAASQLFVVNDILELKDGLIGDTWFKVTAVSDQTTFWRYTASIQAGTNTVTYRAGLGVADYGQSGAGFIILTADRTNSPYEQMATHAATFTSANSAGTLILTPQLRLGNLNGSYGYASDIYGFAAGQYGAASKSWISVDQTNGIRIGNNTTQLAQWNVSGDILVGQTGASQNNTFISAGAFSIRNNVTSLFNVNTAGSLRIGTDISAPATTNLYVSNQSALYNSESFAVGDILVGDNTAASNFGNIKITAGTIKIRRGTTDYITLSATDAQFTNLIKMTGASAAISLGATPPTSASAGTGIWLDRTGLYGLLTNVVQAKLDATTGQIVAGAGNVTISASGITIANSGNLLSWFSGADRTGTITSSDNGTQGYITIVGQGNATHPDGLASMQATSDGGNKTATITLRSTTTTTSVQIFDQGVSANFLGLVVGPGSSTPAAILDVRGNIRSTAGISNFFKGGDVASAGTITATGNLFHVTGTTNITSVSGTGIIAGTKITIIFDGILTFTDGSNLKLAGNFVTTADDTITLAYDGTNWYEIARSIN